MTDAAAGLDVLQGRLTLDSEVGESEQQQQRPRRLRQELPQGTTAFPCQNCSEWVNFVKSTERNCTKNRSTIFQI